MTILITGANRGIGLELVTHYLAAGETIIPTTRRDIPTGLEDRVEWHQLDVTQQSDFERLNQALDGRAVDLLICNAGVYLDKGQSLADGYPPEYWADTFAANVMGPFLSVQNLLPNLQAAKAARIAVIASRMGSNTAATGGAYIYRASKAAAINLVTNLALDLAHLNIAVGAYHPGWVTTDMGGQGADIDPQTSAAGLIEQIAALNLENSGCFQSYDGTPLPY